MIRLLIVFLSAFAISYSGLKATSGVITPIYAEVLAAFITVTLVFGALSFALYSYLDGIAKDLPNVRGERPSEKYEAAVDAISALRTEVIVNIFLVISLLVLERCALGLSSVAQQQAWQLSSPHQWAILSFRFSCLLTSLVAAAVQFKGFLVANQLRDHIAKHVQP